MESDVHKKSMNVED